MVVRQRTQGFQMKLWQCSMCDKVGLWGPEWTAFSSLLIDDECPRNRVVACSKTCEEKAELGHNLGTIMLPKIKLIGYSARVVRGPVGYKPQPSQLELIKKWNESHKDDQIRTEFSCP